MTEQFYAFRAYNSTTIYGWGTQAEADAYADIINEGREISHYHVYPTTPAEAAEHGVTSLDDEAFNLADELAIRKGL